jgi:hypothetical protein
VVRKIERALGIPPGALQKHPNEVLEPRENEKHEFAARSIGPVSREDLEELNEELESVVAELKLVRRAKELIKKIRDAGGEPKTDIDL